MSSNLKRIIGFLLTAILLTVFSVTCFVSAGEELPIVEEPLRLSIFIPSRSPDAMYTEDTLTLKELRKRTNIEFEITTVYERQRGDKFRLILASGDYPDIMYGGIPDLNKFGMLGAFVPLNDLIEKHGPNIQKYLVDDKTAYAETVAVDGNLYCVPMLSAIRTSMGYCIRQDWLDRLGLKPPVTIDDWYEVLKAFKENDANGNGDPNDEVPLFLDTPWENAHLIFADAFGIEANPVNDYWCLVDDTVEFAPIQAGFRDYLETMSKWYKEGLIDEEFVTREGAVDYFMMNNIGGASVNWTGWLAAFNAMDEITTQYPGYNMQVIPPPVLKRGDKPRTFWQQKKVVSHAWAISVTNRYPEETMKLFDYVYSDEGTLLFNFGIEDVTYNMVNGKPEYTEEVKGSPQFLRQNGLQALFGMRQMPEYEAASCATEDIRRQLFSYVDQDYFADPFPTLSLTEAEKEVYNRTMASIKTYIEEETVRFIIGDSSTGWDKYVETVKGMGIDYNAELMNKAYARYKENLK